MKRLSKKSINHAAASRGGVACKWRKGILLLKKSRTVKRNTECKSFKKTSYNEKSNVEEKVLLKQG